MCCIATEEPEPVVFAEVQQTERHASLSLCDVVLRTRCILVLHGQQSTQATHQSSPGHTRPLQQQLLSEILALIGTRVSGVANDGLYAAMKSVVDGLSTPCHDTVTYHGRGQKVSDFHGDLRLVSCF